MGSFGWSCLAFSCDLLSPLVSRCLTLPLVSLVFDFADDLTGYVQFVYSKSKRINQLAQVPMTATRSAGPQWQLNNGRFATRDGYFNVLGGDTSFGFRSIAIGPRIYEYDYDVYGIRAGLDGQFEIDGKTYFWNAGTQVNDARYDSKLYNFVDLVHLGNAVGGH